MYDVQTERTERFDLMKDIKNQFRKYSLAHRVTIIYMVFGVLWIMLSDKFLSFVISDIDVMAFIQTIKGNLYVLITGALLWFLIVIGLKEINGLHDETIKSEAKYRGYFEQGFIGILLFDEEMKVVDNNIKAQTIFGFTKQMLMTMDVYTLLTKDADEIIKNLKSGENLGQAMDVTFKNQMGDNTHTLVSLSKITDDHGTFQNYVAFIQEINEQKKYQDALLALNNQLEKRVLERTNTLDKTNQALKKSLTEQEYMSSQLEKSNQSLRVTVEHLNKMQNRLIQTERMTALGNLVASLTHEISTPVGAAMTSGSFIKEKTKLINQSFESGKLTKSEFHGYVENLDESTDIIHRNLSHAAELMSNFKQMAADQTQMDVRCTNMRVLVDEILLSLKPVLKRKNIVYDIDIDPELTTSMVPGYMTQIFNNLLTNSFRHGFSGRDDGKISIRVHEKDGEIFIEYEDDGNGIDLDVQKELFKPFFSTLTRETRDGLSGIGLGLYIIKKIIEDNMKGHIELETELGKYTRFKIDFAVKDCEVPH